MDLSNIKFKSLTDQIYEYLGDSIAEGRIKGGEKLVEKKLCQQFGISRSPLRECFRILEGEGLLTINPRRGTYVRDVSRKDIEDVFICRAKLEGLAAKLAVQNITERDIATFNDLIIKMEEAILRSDIKSFFELNDVFHGIFIKASNNEVLERTLKNFARGVWLRIVFLFFRSPLALNFSNNKHKEIVEAFTKKDAVSIERLVEEHIEYSKNHLLSFFAVQKQPVEA